MRCTECSARCSSLLCLSPLGSLCPPCHRLISQLGWGALGLGLVGHYQGGPSPSEGWFMTLCPRNSTNGQAGLHGWGGPGLPGAPDVHFRAVTDSWYEEWDFLVSSLIPTSVVTCFFLPVSSSLSALLFQGYRINDVTHVLVAHHPEHLYVACKGSLNAALFFSWS